MCYAGGGRKVIRCELSLDGGETWRLADIQRHEKATPYNKYWCWVFWSVEVPAVDLLRSTEIRVRAVDSSNNLMPEKCAPWLCMVPFWIFTSMGFFCLPE